MIYPRRFSHRRLSCRLFRLLFLFLAGTLVIVVPPDASAQDAPDLPNPVQFQPLPDGVVRSHTPPPLSAAVLERIEATVMERRSEKLGLSPTEQKLHPLLRAGDASLRKSTPPPRNPILQYDATGRVRVMVHVGPGVETSALEAAGFWAETVDSANGYLLGAVAPSDAAAVAEVAGVMRIQPLIRSGRVNAGSIVSEGDAALNADDLRAALGADGSGVRIGIISDGTNGAALSQASGDLPAVIEECPISDAAGGGTVTNAGAEGTAMLEIVHDLAPGADLLFCPAFGGGEPGLAASILSLATDLDADVIVDDVAFLTEPYWEDGIVAQAVDQVAADGVAYFSSAGNSGLQHYEAGYVDTVPGDQFSFPADAHDFGLAAGGASEIALSGLVGGTAFAPSNFFAAFLQWTEPFGAAASDYDLYLFDRNGNVAGDPAGLFPVGVLGLAVQDGDDDPLEVAFVLNETPNVEDVLLVIDRFDGEAREVEVNFNGTLAILTFNEPAGSVWGHAAARGAQAVAAIDVSDPGLDDIEPFSSRGPSEIAFPVPETRAKPDITAVDGVSVTGNGGFPTTFFGTSASAPHAAAVAALLLDVNPLLSPAEVTAALARTALDRGAAGPDLTFGAGLVDAFAAGQDVVDDTPPVCGDIDLEFTADGAISAVRTTATDEDSGIESATFTTLDNLTGSIDGAGSFAQGDRVDLDASATTRIDIRGDRVDFTAGGAIVVTVENGSGLTSDCDPVLTQVSSTLPVASALHGNYPNPVREGTTIAFDVAEPGRATLEVFDLLGRRVATLVDREVTPGRYDVEWTRAETRRLAAGTYIYRLRTPDWTEARRLVLVR
jgi:subtilisin family serine protease